MKIFLSPSNQTGNKYAYGNTNEKIQCTKIADACENKLKKYGATVIRDDSLSMQSRVLKSNSENVDLHVPIHTNAFNKKVTGTRVFTYPGSTDGKSYGKMIYRNVALVTNGVSPNMTENSTLYELKYTNAPAVYVECDFHDVKSMAKFIIEHTTEIGNAIADAIALVAGLDRNNNGDENVPDQFQGTKITLKNEPLYATATTKTVANKISGDYYVWSNDVVNDRIRITNRADRVGVVGQVTGWIETDANTHPNPEINGAKITLINVPLYATATTKTVANIINGDYYIWSSGVVNDRIRITNRANRVGVVGQVTGWINL